MSEAHVQGVPTHKGNKVYCEVRCCKLNFAINVAGVWGASNPLTKSLALITRLFVVKEIVLARLFVFPLQVGVWGSAVLGCISVSTKNARC
jgi:hypothetical protein